MFISSSILQFTVINILRQNMIQFVICFFVFQSFVLASVPECSEVDGKYPVYSALPDCTKFYQCSDGTLYLHDCPDGLHFNSVLNVCDWPHRAGCDAAFNDIENDKDGGNGDDNDTGNDNDNDDQNKETSTENSEVNICQQNGIECSEVDDKYPVYFSLPDCTKFCQCSNGKPYLHGCPDGLHFNPELNVCDQPENANCSSISV
ncbi:peritrophin-1-like [Leptinotarsa decemlineata]|uniref:peritrophin-1-like n=1 Tax=Leptinotarsa decemlineata TaxID=7539 RepID=UPI003D309185